MKLIVGLGNPTARYAHTRHNAGWLVLDALHKKTGGIWKTQSQASILETRIGTEKVILLKPLTYMNLSGQAVRPLVHFYKLNPDDILVIQDDLDSEFGLLRLKLGGRSGGQKGVQSIIDHLGFMDFARLKLGISRPAQGWSVSDWVLSVWRDEEKPILDMLIVKAQEAVETWTDRGLLAAQQIYNQTDLRPRDVGEFTDSKDHKL